MLYALSSPVAFLALVAGFVLGVVLRGMVQARLAARLLGDRSATAYGRGRPDPRRHLDAFGAVAAAIGGVGWGRPVEANLAVTGQRRRALTTVLLAGPAALVAAGLILIGGYVAAGGPAARLALVAVPAMVHGGQQPVTVARTLLLLGGVELVAMGVLALIPLPPLDGGQLLFAYAPRSVGWQKAHYRLAEQNIGLGILLVLLLLPLAGRDPLLLVLVDLVVQPVLSVGAQL